MTTSHPAVKLLEALFGQAPHHLWLEIRPIAPDGSVLLGARTFSLLRQLQRRGFEQAIPAGLDGQANVFFGGVLRACQGGTAADVALATCLWADLDHGLLEPWPQAVPPPSVLVETSPGKFQAYWLLAEPSQDLPCVESLVRGLAAALGGDRAATDRARVLRLPGFRNLKYPEQPIARLLLLEPQRRYDLEALGATLPQTSENWAAIGSAPRRTGDAFDPHRGGEDVPEIVKREIAEELRRRGAVPYHDGRLEGPCPFPGHTGQSPSNFYFSPVSGRW